MLAVVAASAAMSLLEPLLPLDLEERFGSSSTVIGLVFGAATLAHRLASPPVGALADRVLRRPLIAGGLLGMAVTIGFAAGPPSPFGVAMVLVAFAVAYSFVLVPVLAEVAAVVRTLGGTAYAAAYGAFNIAYAVGMVVGTTAGSGAMTWLPLTDVLVASGVVLASVALLLAAPLCRAARPLLRPRTDPDPRTTTSEGAL